MGGRLEDNARKGGKKKEDGKEKRGPCKSQVQGHSRREKSLDFFTTNLKLCKGSPKGNDQTSYHMHELISKTIKMSFFLNQNLL